MPFSSFPLLLFNPRTQRKSSNSTAKYPPQENLGKDIRMILLEQTQRLAKGRTVGNICPAFQPPAQELPSRYPKTCPSLRPLPGSRSVPI
jgi:hypothetical protein